MEKNFEYKLEDINNILIKTAWPQIEILTDSADTIRIMITGDDVSVPSVTVKEDQGNLNIEQPYLGINKNLMQGSWMHIMLILPKNYAKPLNVNSALGNCVITGYNGEHLKLDFISGDIKLHEIEAKKLSIREVSGDVNADNISSDYVKLANVSGKYLIKDFSFKTLASNTVSGEQSYYINNEFDSMDFVTVNSDIDIYQVYETVDVSTRSVINSVTYENVQNKEGSPKINVSGVNTKIKIGRNIK